MPMSQSAFARILAASASPWYSISSLMDSKAARIASSSRLATHRRRIGLETPACATILRKMASPSRSGSHALTNESVSSRRISPATILYCRSAPFSRPTFHCQSGVGSMGSVSRLHLPQSWPWYSSGAARSTRWPCAQVTRSSPTSI